MRQYINGPCWHQSVIEMDRKGEVADPNAGVTKEYDMELSIDDGNGTNVLGARHITVTWGNSTSN